MASGRGDPVKFIDKRNAAHIVDYGTADLFGDVTARAGGREWYKALYRSKVVSPLEFIFSLGFFTLVGVCIVNAGYAAYNFQFTYSYFLDIPVGSVLRSQRSTFPWILLGATHLRMMLIWTSCFSQTVPGSTFRHLVHIMAGCLVLAADVGIILFLGISWGMCNTSGNPNNMCNDPLFCCAYFSDPSNNCPNVLPCVPSVSANQLSSNSDFVWVFWVNAVGAVADLCVVIPVALLWSSYAYLTSYISEEKNRFGSIASSIATSIGEAVNQYVADGAQIQKRRRIPQPHRSSLCGTPRRDASRVRNGPHTSTRGEEEHVSIPFLTDTHR